MSARIPLLKKTPFVLDPRPLSEASSPHAGLLATSRAYRSLGVPDLMAACLKLRKRQRGYSEGQMGESLILLQTLQKWSLIGLMKPIVPRAPASRARSAVTRASERPPYLA